MKLRKSNERKSRAKDKISKTGSLPAGYRHLVAVALGGVGGLAATIFLGAFSRRSFAGAGLRGRSFILAPPRGQVVQELLANFSLQRGRILNDLRSIIG
jgi:hypothetical protein